MSSIKQESIAVVNAIDGLHNLRIPFYLGGALVLATIIAGMVAIALTAGAAPFSTLGHYRIFLVPAISTVVLAFAYFSWAHNLRRTTTSVAIAIAIITIIIMLVFSIWAAVDVGFRCADVMPLYCTNGITEDILAGYWIYAVSLWIVTLLWIGWLIILQIASYYLRRLTNVVSGIEQRSLFDLLYTNRGEFPTTFVTAIGSQKTQ